MPRLILLNGAPAAGKSTLARRWVAEHPMALALDIDVIRSMLGASMDDPEGSGVAARRLAVEMARRHLVDGHDVIVPQFLGRDEFIDELADLAHDVGVEFFEMALIVPLDELRQRLVSRSQRAEHVAHRDAATMLKRSTSIDPLAEMHAALGVLLDHRRWTIQIDNASNHIDDAMQHLSAAFD